MLLSAIVPVSGARGEEPPATLSLSRRQAVEQALASHPALAAAGEQVEQARARVSEATALPDPSFTATWNDAPGLLDPRGAASTNLDLGLTLPFPTRLKLGGDVARSALRVTQLSAAQLRSETSAQVAQAYDALLVAERHREDLTQSRALAADFVSKTEARFQGGTVPRVDVIKAKVDLAQAENGLIANERAVATARATLNRLLGRAPGAPLTLTDPLNVPPPLPDLDRLLPLAATSRPEALSVAEQRAGAHLSSRLAGQYWLPDLDLTVTRNFYSGGPATYSTALGVGVPLFFWQHRKGQLAEAKHRELELTATARDVAAQVELDVRTAWAAADTARRQATYLQEQLLPEAQDVFRVASASYGLGGSSALELLDAKRTLLDAQSQLADALGAANDARADLERAVGAPLPLDPSGGTDAR